MPRLPAAMLAGLIGTVLSACAANPPASNPAPTAATTPTPALAYAHSDPHSQITNENLAPWFLEARDLVSRNLQVDLSSVVATVASAEQIASQARTSLLGALSHDLANNDFAESLVDNILSAQTASVLAIYSPQRQSILLHRSNLRDYLAANGPDVTTKSSIQALLIHELIHAADDVRYNAFNRKGASYQEVFAKSTIIEGHAQWQTRRLCELANCTTAFNALNHYMFDVESPDDPALRYVQNRNFKNLEFVYREGERFIDKLMQRRHGEALVSFAFKQPPRDSIQIIDPASFPNRARENRNLALSAAITESRKPWSQSQKGTLKRNVLAAAAFSVNPEARAPIVEFYTSKILAAAKHEFYDRVSDTPIPIAIIALRTNTAKTARDTAALIFETTSRTYSGLGGDLVKLENWNTSSQTKTLPGTRHVGSTTDLNIDIYTASGNMRNGMVGANYPVEVVTATSGQYIVHIDGRHDGLDKLTQYAAELLSTLRQSEQYADSDI